MAAQDSPTYRLYQLAAPGSLADTMALATQPRPSAASLGKRQLLVEVAYAGLNPADYKLPGLGLGAKAMIKFPWTPGMDFSGRIVAVADDVPDDVKVGDRVVGRLNPLLATGSLAEYVVADYEGVAALPSTVSLEQAAGVGTAALTAYQTMAPSVQKPGAHIFINGGSGGTGTFGIQIAKAMGAHVTTTVSTGKVALASGLGADVVIDYKTTPDVVAALRGQGPSFAAVLDFVGKSPANLFSASKDLLLPGGHFCTIAPSLSLDTVRDVATSMLPAFLGGSPFKYETPFTKQSHEDLVQIAAWMRDGKVRTVVDTVYAFEQAPEAYGKLKQGSSTGKIIVRVKALE